MMSTLDIIGIVVAGIGIAISVFFNVRIILISKHETKKEE